jgi:hypothetical protein
MGWADESLAEVLLDVVLAYFQLRFGKMIHEAERNRGIGRNFDLVILRTVLGKLVRFQLGKTSAKSRYSLGMRLRISSISTVSSSSGFTSAENALAESEFGECQKTPKRASSRRHALNAAAPINEILGSGGEYACGIAGSTGYS